MAVVRWEPFRELAALQSEMGRWMNQLAGTPAANGQGSSWLPAVDAWETETELVLAFDLPGIPEEKIEVEVDDGILTVSGERERTHQADGERFYRYERRFGAFSRSVSLPAGVDEDAISAEYRDGVLEIRVRKPEEAQPKRIRVGGRTPETIEGTATEREVA